MKTTLKFLTYLSALLGISIFLRPADDSAKTLLWIPKLMGGALSPILRITSGWGAVMGLLRRDWGLTAAGILGLGLATRFIKDLPNNDEQFDRAFGFDKVEVGNQWDYSARYLSTQKSTPIKVDFARDIICGQNPQSGAPLFADLWQPSREIPHSGLGVVYAHGSGWRVGDKDMLTRHFFQHLARQGPVSYTHLTLPTTPYV